MAELVRKRKYIGASLLAAAALTVFAGAFAATNYFSKYFDSSSVKSELKITEPSIENKPSSKKFLCISNSNSVQVYVDSSQTEDKFRLFKSSTLELSSLSNNGSVLTVACDSKKTIWWITDQLLFSASLRLDLGGVYIDKSTVNQISHMLAPEYEAAKVIAANIMILEHNEGPFVMTLTDTGLLRLFRPPSDGFTIKETMLISLPRESPNDERSTRSIWPLKRGAVIGFINKKEFAVIPMSVGSFYFYINYEGEVYEHGPNANKLKVFLDEYDPSISTIVRADQIILDEITGGVVTNLFFTYKSGDSGKLHVILKPKMED